MWQHEHRNASALTEVNRIADGLAAAGYLVVRRKIETVPWHPAAPSELNGVRTMPAASYFEAHFNVIVSAATPDTFEAQREALVGLARTHGAHLSRNVFKQLSPTQHTLMLTLRSYADTRERFTERRDVLMAALTAGQFVCDKLITEFSLFDSRVTHDASWLEA